MLRTNHYRHRRAIGLVELMVAMALSIGIMWILAESFKMGLDFTRHAHSTGTMMSQLDGARAIMARDLLAEHFLPDDNKPNRGVRLSDQRLDSLTNNPNSPAWYPPTGGFFRIISPQPTLIADSNGYSMNSVGNHALHFTSILSAKDQNLYSVNIGGVNYYSRAVEVTYFLVDTGMQTAPGQLAPPGTSGPQKLYNLIRRQRLVAMTNDEISSLQPASPTTLANTDPNAEVIAGPVGRIANTPNANTVYRLSDVTNPANRLQISPITVPAASNSPLTFGIGSARYGEDLLLANVLSFEVMVDWGQNTGNPQVAGDEVPGSVITPRTTLLPSSQPNWDWPFDYLATNAGKNPSYLNQGVFDTWYPVANWNNFGLSNNAAALPLAVRVKQLQITIRIFDPKTKQARQSTGKYSQ